MPKKIKLTDLKVTSFLTNLATEEKAKIRGGDETIYPCEISAPQIICNTEPDGYTCVNCEPTNSCIGCGGGSSNDPYCNPSCDAIIC